MKANNNHVVKNFVEWTLNHIFVVYKDYDNET